MIVLHNEVKKSPQCKQFGRRWHGENPYNNVFGGCA